MMISLLGRLVLMSAATFQAPPASPPGDEFSRIDRWVQEWQPTEMDRKFEQIGWVKDIPTALRLAKQHGRPVFVFTHKGQVNLGRQ
jgi:hypothetical protein